MNKLIDAVKTFLSGVEYMEQEENAKYVVTREDKELLQEAIDTVIAEVEKPTYTPADMEEFSYWYHRKVSVIGESELHLFGVRPFEDIISFWKKEKETTE